MQRIHVYSGIYETIKLVCDTCITTYMIKCEISPLIKILYSSEGQPCTLADLVYCQLFIIMDYENKGTVN